MSRFVLDRRGAGRPGTPASPAIVALVTSLVVGVAGCPARRAGVARDSLDGAVVDAAAPADLPTLAELLRLRVPEPASRPATITGPAAAVAFASGDAPGAATDNDAEVLALRCLHADVTRDYDAIVPSCTGLAAARPADPRAIVAVGLLARHRGSLTLAARRAALAALPALVPACTAARDLATVTNAPRPSCAELAGVVDDARRELAVSLGDRAALDAARPGADVHRGTAEGPFLDGDEAFASSPFAARPLARHPRYRVFDLDERDGTLAPSRRATPGWWRLTLRAEAPRTATGLLAIRAEPPFEVRVDGVPVVERSRGSLAADVERVGIAVDAGLHVIEVLLRDGGRGVRITAFAEDGQPLLTPATKQKWSRPAAFRLVDGAGVVDRLPLPTPFVGSDATQLATLLFRHAFARSGFGSNADEERLLARRLISDFGWSAPALVAAAQTVEGDVLPDRIANALALPLWAAVRERWSTHPVAMIAAARAAGDDRPDEVLPRYRALVAANPRYPFGRRELIGALLERRVYDEARAQADALLALGETNENIDAALPALQATGDLGRAARLADERARRTLDGDWRRRLQAGGTVEVRAELDRRLGPPGDHADHRDPNGAGPRGGYEDDDVALRNAWLALAELDRPLEALRRIDDALTDAPDSVELRLRRARLLARTAGLPAARRALDDVATADARVLQLQALWDGLPPVGDRLARGDDVIAARRRATSEPFPGFATVFLLDDAERRFFADGTSVFVRHWIVELRSKQALDAFGELRVGDDEQLARLRVVKPDGAIIEAERNSGVEELSLPSLAPGDVIEWLSWAVDDSARDGAFWETRALVRSTPAVERSYVVEVPTALSATRRVQVLTLNGAAAPTTTSTDTGAPARGEVVRHVFRVPGAPPLLDEPGAVDAVETEPQGGITIDLDDDVFRRRRARALLDHVRVDAWLVDAAHRIAGRGPGPERLQRLFHFVTNKVVEADAPADAVSTLVVGRGRRQALFHALAAAAGLAPRAVALHAPLVVERRIPHNSAFPLTATVVNVDGEPHLALIGGGTAVLDALSPGLSGAATLDLVDGRAGVLDERHIDRTPTRLTIALAAAGAPGATEDDGVDSPGGPTLRGTVTLRIPAFVAGAVRGGLRQLSEARLGQVVEASLAASLPGVRVTGVRTPGLEFEGRPLALVVDVELAVVGDTVRLEHVFQQGATAAFGLAEPLGALVGVAERHRALRVLPDVEVFELRVQLPAGSAVIEVPPDVTLTAGPVTLTQKASVDDRGFLWERRIDRAAVRVPPSAWPELRAALAPLLAQVDGRVAFVVAPTTSP